MRILFTRFPLESAHGGAENQTLWLAKGLKDRGHDVCFLGSCPILLDAFSTSDMQAMPLQIGPPPVSRWRALSFLWRKKAMKHSLIHTLESLPQKPDVLVMLSMTEKLLLTPWAFANGIRVFWVEHDRIGSWLTMNPWLSLLKKSAGHATVICVSELSRRMMVESGFNASAMVAIPNGVPFPPLRERLGVGGSQGFRLGCLSRLSREKGVDVLVQAIAAIPEASLSIVGVGREEGYVRTLIETDHTRSGTLRITLVPHVSDLDAWYEGLDVLVLPSSEHDPFGLVVAEAMMRGIATVVTDACGIAGSLHEGIDVLVAKAGDPVSLAACLRKLVDPVFRKKIAEKGAAAAREQFSLKTMIDRYETCFSKQAA